MYNTRSEFIEDTISEKITLVHLSASYRLYGFDVVSPNVYSKNTDYIVTQVIGFTKAANSSVSLGEFFYEVSSKTLYLGTDQDIDNTPIIAYFRLLFSDAPIILNWDLSDSNSDVVEYEARVTKSPQLKSKIGSDQQGISLSSTGVLDLENEDGFFDDIYDFLVFENKEVDVYSYNRNLPLSEVQVIFRGNIYNKTFSSDKVSFQIKDRYTRLDRSIELEKIEDDKFKRLIYGKNSGVKVRSTDKIGEGYPLTGTIYTEINVPNTVYGVLTNFDSEVSVGNLVEINSEIYKVETIVDDFEMTVSSLDGSTVEAEGDSISKVTLTSKPGTLSTSLTAANELEGVGVNFSVDLPDDNGTILVNGTYLDYDAKLDNNTLRLTANYPESFTSKSYSLKDTDDLSGEVSMYPNNRLLKGTGTDFLNQVSPGDELTNDGNTYRIQRVISSTELLVEDDSPITFNLDNVSMLNKSQNGVPFKNRTFLVSGHYLKEEYYTWTSQPQANRVVVDDTKTLKADEVLSFYVGGNLIENIEVLRISGSTIVLKQNLSQAYDNTVTIFRNPITQVYIEGKAVDRKNLLSIDNQADGCSFTLSESAEFDISDIKIVSTNLLFKSGSREVSILGTNTDLSSKISTRDFIKGYGDSDNLLMEVLEVLDNKIVTRTPYRGFTGIKKLVYRDVLVIDDSTTVSVDTLGKPEGNIKTGKLLDRGADIVLDILNQTELGNDVELSSFQKASIASPYILGKVIPSEINATTLPTVKSLVDEVNKTVYGAMFIDNNLKIKYNILDTELPIDGSLPIIKFDDIIKWTVKSKADDIYLTTIGKYAFNEANVTNSQSEHTNISASQYDTSIKTQEIKMLSQLDTESDEMIERLSFVSSSSRTEITIDSDLRLSKLSMGDKVIVDLPRLFKRLGDKSSSLRICTVTSLTISGNSTKLVLSDIGNLYNKTAKITNNSADIYTSSNSEEKAFNSFITDENGTIDNLEELQNSNLIF